MLNETQLALLIEHIKKHFTTEEAEVLLLTYPMTGPSGLRRMIGQVDREYFCKAYLSDQFDREFGNYAIEILDTLGNAIESKAQEKIAIIAPREHGKSTLSTFAMPAHTALYGLKKFILFISANADTAANFLEKTKRALESNEIVEDFGAQKGKVWNADNICLRNGTWIACTGWKSGIRGINKDTRPDLIILDDLEDKGTIESDSLRAKLETCFKEEIGRLGYYKTDFFYIGTLLSTDSLLAKVSQEPSWKTYRYKCVLRFPYNEQLWEEWRKIYRDMSNENRTQDAYQFYLDNLKPMIKGAKTLWPGRFPVDKVAYKGSYYNIMLEREAWGEDAFWKEAQNEPRNAADKPFKNISTWEVYPEPIKKFKLAIDPSEGKGDSTAYVVGGGFNEGVFIKDAHKALHNPYQLMDEVVRLIKEYPAIDEVLLESNLFKDLLKSELIKKLCDNDCYRTVTNLHASENKETRIMKMEPDIVGGKILFNPLNVSFNEEVKDYSIKPKCKHDDCADGLQILWKNLKKPSFYVSWG
jgi:predicted phage terminase large subunit-like protein